MWIATSLNPVHWPMSACWMGGAQFVALTRACNMLHSIIEQVDRLQLHRVHARMRHMMQRHYPFGKAEVMSPLQPYHDSTQSPTLCVVYGGLRRCKAAMV